MAKKLSALGLLMKKLSVLCDGRLEKIERKVEMLVEGLPYVDFEYSFSEGELIMEYEEGTSIVEDNIDFDNGDLTIQTTE